VSFFQFPNSEVEWTNIAQYFKQVWLFDTCCGRINGNPKVLVAVMTVTKANLTLLH
jgi:hypothetical protein